MRDAGITGDHVIDGVIGAMFYLEPIEAQDLDVFVVLPRSPGGALLALGPIYEYLLARGYPTSREYIIIDGWDVQFVPPGKLLVEEALANAVEHDVEELKVRVFTAKYLAAFIEQGAMDAEKFDTIVQRHGLLAKWRDFEKAYRPPRP